MQYNKVATITTPKSWHSSGSTANTNTDGTGTLVTLATAGASGTRVDSAFVKATGTVTNGNIRFFITDAGSTTRLVYELLVNATTPSTTVKSFEATTIPRADGTPVFFLNPSEVLKWSTNNAESFNVEAIGGDQ